MCAIFTVGLNHLKEGSRPKQTDNGTGRSRASRRGDPRPEQAPVQERKRELFLKAIEPT